jgi:hypothetical protein
MSNPRKMLCTFPRAKIVLLFARKVAVGCMNLHIAAPMARLISIAQGRSSRPVASSGVPQSAQSRRRLGAVRAPRARPSALGSKWVVGGRVTPPKGGESVVAE